MHILLAHNYYQIPGGEDDLFEATRDLLRSQGHVVTEFVYRNDEIRNYSPLQMASLPVRTTWAWDTNRELRSVLIKARPDVVHFGNTFPLISPSAYYTCCKAGIPIVQSLDNPRLICPRGSFFRENALCSKCEGRVPIPAIIHSCYRESAAQTASVVAMLGIHGALNTWQRKVDAYLVATEFYLRKFLDFGIPQERIHVRPLFIADPGKSDSNNGEYVLFMGRLSPEKGILTLLTAWQDLKIPLKIRGAGPLEPAVRDFVASHSSVELVPRLSEKEKYELIRKARFLVWPSLGYYETFGLVVAEAYACSVPVLASRTGVAVEMVSEGKTGMFFEPNNANDLSEKILLMWQDQARTTAMGEAGRKQYESRFTPAQAYDRIMSVYRGITPVAPKSATHR